MKVTVGVNSEETRETAATSYGINSATGKVLGFITSGGNGAFNIEADFSSFGTDKFTLNFVNTTTSQCVFGWVVVADGTTAQNFPVTISGTYCLNI